MREYKTINVSELDVHLNGGWILEQLSHPTAVIYKLEPKCPECGFSRDNPKRYVAADGYGRLNIYCENSFHRGV